jgi:hypothetical protein
MMGGLHGNWALLLVLYAVLLAVAIGAHVVWVWRMTRDVWRSGDHTAYKTALTTLLIVTPIVGFYAIRTIPHLRAPFHGSRLGIRNLVMSAMAAATVLACAAVQIMRYSPGDRTLQAMLGFIPGFLALYAAMQLIMFMAASVSGLSQRGFLSSRTHLLSASILLAAGVVIR